jgi:hypothetical protein
MNRKLFSFFLLLTLILTACIKERFDPGKFDPSVSLDPGLAVPVGFSTLRVEKFLRDASNDSILFIAPDGFVSVVYKKNVVSGNLTDMISIPPASYVHTVNNETGVDMILDLITDPVIYNYDLPIPVSLNTNNAEVDSIKLLSGSLLTGINVSGLSGTIEYVFPGLRKNGDTLRIHTPLAQPVPVSLTGYTLICTNNGTTGNLLDCSVSLTIENSTGTIAPGAPIMTVTTDISDLMFETIYGNFEGFEIPIDPIQYAPGIFNNIVKGSFEFAAPKISLYLSNSIGAAAGIAFTELKVVDSDNLVHVLSGPGVPTPASPKVIAYPSLSQEGESVNDSIIFDNTNSNLSELLVLNPDSISLTAIASLYPPENNQPAFLRYDSKYSIDAAFDLPIWGNASLELVQDTLEFSYLGTSLPVPREIDSLIVRLIVWNQFPVSVKPQIYLLDENRLLLDSLFHDEQAIDGAKETDSDGKFKPLEQKISIGLSAETIQYLTQTHYIVTSGKIETSNFPDYVKFYTDYILKYNIGLIAQLTINTGEK